MALRDDLLEIATQLESGEVTESEHLVDRWVELCPHPVGSDLLFWPDQHGLPNDWSAGQTVDYALDWQPRTVAMTVDKRAGGEAAGYYIYTLSAPDTPRTQVVTDVRYEVGDCLAVALKGMTFEDGRRVGIVHNPDYDNAYSCGVILSKTAETVGTIVDRL